MIFLTVGTQFGFDRLVSAVDRAYDRRLVDEPLFAQIGNTSYRPRNFGYVSAINKDEFDAYCERASAIIGHAGMGTISMAMAMQKPLLAMPRLARRGEVVNDHQVDIARKFSDAGHILVAWNEQEVPEKLTELRSFVPQPREAQPEAVTEKIKHFLEGISG